MSALRGVVPALAWLPVYDRRWLRSDLVAGLTLWVGVPAGSASYAPTAAALVLVVAALAVVGADSVYPTADAAVHAVSGSETPFPPVVRTTTAPR